MEKLNLLNQGCIYVGRNDRNTIQDIKLEWDCKGMATSYQLAVVRFEIVEFDSGVLPDRDP